jgi:hypothetical protein
MDRDAGSHAAQQLQLGNRPQPLVAKCGRRAGHASASPTGQPIPSRALILDAERHLAGRCVMGRKTALRLGVGLVFVAMIVGANFVSTPAAAQGNCPPGQVFVPVENKCVGLGGVTPAQRCPQGQEYDERTNRCVTAGRVRCPQGQEYDERTNRCVTAGRVRCPQGQEYDDRTNRCVTAGRGVRCPQGQEYDDRTNRCR